MALEARQMLKVITAVEEHLTLLLIVMQLWVLEMLLKVLEKLEQPMISCFGFHLALQQLNQPVQLEAEIQG